MAGHFPLSKIDEPRIFRLVDKIKNLIISNGSVIKDFEKFKITVGKNSVYEIMKLSKDYVENPIKEFAFNVGKFSLESITDEHPSLTKNISLECHFLITEKTVIKKIIIKDIFWVA